MDKTSVAVCKRIESYLPSNYSLEDLLVLNRLRSVIIIVGWSGKLFFEEAQVGMYNDRVTVFSEGGFFSLKAFGKVRCVVHGRRNVILVDDDRTIHSYDARKFPLLEEISIPASWLPIGLVGHIA